MKTTGKTKAGVLWPLALILIIWLAFTFPYWGKGLIPFPSAYLVNFFPPWNASYGMPVKNNAMPDVITQIYPWKKITIDAWKNGEIPLWNPYSFSGTAHAANYQSAVFSPVNILFFLFPYIDAWSIMIVLQPILAGIGMYLFLRSLNVSAFSGAIGSIAYMFCGFMTVWMAYGTLGYAAAWLPYALFAVRKHMQKAAWAAPFLSIVLCFSLLSGHFQISLYVLGYTALYILFTVMTAKKKMHAVWLYVSMFLGIVLAAPQVIPSFAAYQESVRSGLFLKGEIIPWEYAFTVFAPDFYGNPVTRNDWFGHYAEWGSYVGVVPLVLACIAAVHAIKKNISVLFFAGCAVFFILLAFPTPVNDLMYALHIPVLSTSAASRVVVLISFSLSVLAAYGVDALSVLWQKKRFRAVVFWCISMSAMLAVLWLWLIFGKPFETGRMHVAVRNTVLPTALAVTTVAIMVTGLFVPKRFFSYLFFILVLCTAFDMYRYAAKWMPFDSREFIYPELPIMSVTRALTGDSHVRVFGNLGGEFGNYYSIPLVEGYDAVYKARYGEFIRSIHDGQLYEPERSVAQFPKHGKYNNDMINLLGVRYILHKVQDGRQGWAFPFWAYPQYQRVYADDIYEVYENMDAYPRAFLASAYKVYTTKEDILNALYDPDITRNETLILEQEPGIKPATGAGTAEIVRYDTTRITIDTFSQSPKLLFLSDVHDDGWHVSVDGKDAALFRANYAFRAVAVPAGRHSVHMWYWPMSFSFGLVAFGFGTLGCIGMYLKQRYENRIL